MPVANSVTLPWGVMRPIVLADLLGEPEVAVRTGRDGKEAAGGGDAGCELGDDALGRDPADAVAALLGEPEVAVRTGRDARDGCQRRCRCELGDVPWGVIRPIRLPLSSVNQRLPSGPAVMPSSWLAAVMPAPNSMMGTVGRMVRL